MNIDTFWQMIDETRAASSGDPDKQTILLEERLTHEPLDEIIAFERIWLRLDSEAFRADLWDAAYVIGCGCSDDGFMDFRAWLVQQGKDIFEAALADPETLVNVVEHGPDTQRGGLWAVAMSAWKNKTDETCIPNLDNISYSTHDFGEMRPTHEEKHARFPKLAAKFKPQCKEWWEEALK
jgi:hypothetical protein